MILFPLHIFTRVTFVNNFADDDGGAILNKDSMYFDDCLFEHNITDDDGGAICSDSSAFTYIVNSYFLFNDAYEEGGAIYSDYGSFLHVDSSIFSENIGDIVGGAISIYGAKSLISSSEFDYNFSYLAGGGIHSVQSQLEIENCSFNDNESEHGGGIFSLKESVLGPLKSTHSELPTKSILGGFEPFLKVYGSHFNNNFADYAGGAITNVEGDVEIATSRFNGNESEFGGAVSNGVVEVLAPFKENFTAQIPLKCLDCVLEFNGGEMSIDSSTFKNNLAFFGIGGGIGVHKGELKMTNSQLDSNLAFWGGAIMSVDAFLDIDSAHFFSDSAYVGGAIFSISSNLGFLEDPQFSPPQLMGMTFIRNSTFLSNWSEEVGGALMNVDIDLSVDGNIFKANESVAAGGAIFGEYGALTSTNNLFSGNYSGDGGAITIVGDIGVDPITFFSKAGKKSTKKFKKPNSVERLEESSCLAKSNRPIGPNEYVFINNTFGFNEAVYDGGAMFVHNAEDVYIINSIISGNRDSSGLDSMFSGVYNDNSGISFEHSLVQGSGGSMSWENDLGIDVGNNIDSDPLFIMNTDTTHLPNSTGDLRLLTCSPAVNVGKDTTGLGLGQVDLDDNPRIFGPAIDMGAFELQSILLGDLVVINTNDSGCGSLRYAVANAEPGDTITFDSGIDGTPIKLTSGEISIDTNLVIIGNDTMNTIVDGNVNSRVFHVGLGDTVKMVGIKIQNGQLEGSNCPQDCGAGILNFGVLNLDRVAIVNNTVEDTIIVAFGGGLGLGGGGLYNNGGDVEIKNSCFIKNEALNNHNYQHADGAAIYNLNGNVELYNSLFYQNDADDDGAAVYNIGTSGQGLVSMNEVEIKDNLAGNHGAIFNHLSNTVIRIDNSTISGNSGIGAGAIFNNGSVFINKTEIVGNSGVQGGAIFNSSSTLEITNSILSGNLSTDEGGAIFNQGFLSATPVVLKNSTLSGNKSGKSGGAIYNNNLGVSTTIDMANTIIALNIDDGSGPDIYKASGTVIDRGGNLISNITSVESELDTSTLLGSALNPLDPLFIMDVDTFSLPNISGNLRLDCQSQAIEAGNIDTAGLGLGLIDLDDKTRIFGSFIDIGAYENQQPECQLLDFIGIKGQGMVCEGSNTVTYVCEVEYASGYEWSYNGIGSFIGGINGTEANLDFTGDELGGGTNRNGIQ